MLATDRMPARPALVLAILLAFASAASAGGSVDWGPYLEKPGTTYTSLAKPAPAAAATAPAASTKPAALAKPAAKAKKVKAKAPAKARRKQR
jgi:hypothetical protein